MPRPIFQPYLGARTAMPTIKPLSQTFSLTKDAEALISVVVPVYNEEESLEAFYDAVSEQLNRLGMPWELVFVNDGSQDRSLEILHWLHERDSRVRVIDFARNFGHQIAITAGGNDASGDAVIFMDADLQHPPELIPEMIRLWQEGNHVVYTVRSYGEEIGWLKKKTSQWFYSVLNRISDTSFIPGAADFRLMDRRVVDSLNEMPERSRFVRGMVSWLGFRQIGIPYIANPRKAGVSKYTLRKMLAFALDGITGFSTKPLRWITYLGMMVASVSILYACYVLFETIFLGLQTPGWPTLIITVLLLGGVQLISLGVIGEYIGKIYVETKQRPLYVVQKKIGFAAENSEENDDRLAVTSPDLAPEVYPILLKDKDDTRSA
ncbi:MAG: glycosyltransferase family 2 protein [Planctomycetaceae bacterium]|nr:glycosyltransferase family 2 protein [Planctomycetaceae bacterium]